MRWCIIFVTAILTACDNNTFSDSSVYSLFETSKGVVYLINQRSGELDVVSPKQTTTVREGEIFYDGEGRYFKYLGAGEIEEVEEIESLIDKYAD